ncbi:hypothetical protein [Streptomyces sp. NPDC048623]|uniref:hypothetical protein n=1 Tax=Streptomyces sp. NPDC048623 TaxID=3155761 RepID=UPI00341EF201
MTTATTVTGRPLSDWSRAGCHGTWHALLPLPDRSDEPALGALRIDRTLPVREGARERLKAAVLGVARLRLPGTPATVDLVVEAGEVWLITGRPPVPTLTDLLAADAPGPGLGPDAGSVASVLNETAQTLLALHAAGLAHGSLTGNCVVLGPDGTALLTEAALAMALGDGMSTADLQRADIAAWAALARSLGDAWAPPGSPAAELFVRCGSVAESDGLGAARAALVAGRAVLPAHFLRRTALRAAAAAAMPDLAPRGLAPRTPEHPPPVTAPVAPSVPPASAPAANPAANPAADASDEQPTALGRRSRTAESTARPSTVSTDTTDATDAQATVLGKRHRDRLPGPRPAADADRNADADAAADSDILLRFGPGVPTDEQDALSALWQSRGPAPARRRRRRGLWSAATAVLTAAAVVLWLALLRPGPGPTVTAADVQAPTAALHCGQTADVIGVLTTDGRGGPVTYRWLRGEGEQSEELTRTARRGEARVTVHLRWTVSGPGRFRGTARLQVLRGDAAPLEAEDSFTYSCP